MQKKVTEEGIRMAPTGEVHDAQGRFVDPETSRRVRENVNELVMEDGNDMVAAKWCNHLTLIPHTIHRIADNGSPVV